LKEKEVNIKGLKFYMASKVVLCYKLILTEFTSCTHKLWVAKC